MPMPRPSAHESPPTSAAREAKPPTADGRHLGDGARHEEARLGKGVGWYATFIVLAVALFVGIGYYTGLEVVAATARFLGNALLVVAIGAVRAAGGLLALLAKGVGWRRLS